MTSIRGKLLTERRRLRAKADERQPLLHKFLAKIGDGEGNIYPDLDDLSYVFIRRTGRGRVQRVRNTKVKAIHGLNVIVGYAPELPNTLQVLDVDDVSYGLALGGYSYVKNHHQQHELLNPQGGGDTTWIYTQQFLYLLCQVTDPPSATLRIRDGRFIFQGAYRLFPGQVTADMTTFAPGAGEAVMVLIAIDANTLTATYTVSPAFSDALPPNSWFNQVPVAPDLSIPIAAVYVPNGATTFDWDYILDWRVFVGTVGDVQAHNIFSATHSDTLADAIVRGDMAAGLDTTPTKLGRLAIGAPGDILHVNAGGTDPEWGNPPLFDDYVLRSQWLQNGFVDEAEVSLAWDDASLTLTVDSVGANFNYFHTGLLYTRTGPDTKIIFDIEGIWVFYYDGATLTSLHNPTHAQVGAVIEDQTIVAYVYWDAANNDGRLMYELHGYRMSPITHHWLHDNIGSVYRTGMALADFVIDDSGDDDEDAQFSVASGMFHDEDLKIELDAVGKLVGLEIWYTVGANWRWTTNAGFSILTDAGTGRMAYNDAGAQAPVDNNNFALCHIYATNIMSDAGADPKYIAVQGIAQYGNINDARDGADTEINTLTFGTLPLEELVPVGTIIFQTANGYLNAVQSRTRTTDSGNDYVDWRGSTLKATGGLVASHSALADLNVPGDHPAYLMHDGTRAMTGNLDLNGNTAIFDADGDAYIWSPIDDVIDMVLPGASGEFGININGAEDFTFTANSFNVLAGSNISLASGSYIGIPGNELLTVNAAGTWAFSGVTGISVENGDWIGAGAGCAWLYDSGNGDISTAAKLGVLTTAPASAVDIYGNLRLGSASGSGRYILSRNDAGAGNYRDLGIVANEVAIKVATVDEGTASTTAIFCQKVTANVGIAMAAPLAKLHVDQSSNSAVIPVLTLDQADLSEEFINFVSTVGGGYPIQTGAIGTYYGKVRVAVNGTFKYVALYNS